MMLRLFVVACYYDVIVVVVVVDVHIVVTYVVDV